MANINKPTIDGSTIPYPDAATIEPIWVAAEQTTMLGKTRRDVMARKYSYTLKWTYLNSDYYNALESAINKLAPVIFVYEKWPQSAAGVEVIAKLSGRELTAGVGDYYWSSVTLECTEVNSRI